MPCPATDAVVAHIWSHHPAHSDDLPRGQEAEEEEAQRPRLRNRSASEVESCDNKDIGARLSSAFAGSSQCASRLAVAIYRRLIEWVEARVNRSMRHW